MRTTLQRRIAATTAALTMTALVAACGGGTTTGSSSAAKDVSAVKDDQLKGVTIQLARFFGDCTDTVGKKTDISKVVGECETIQTLTNKFNTENKYGIKVERLGGAAWESYYDQLNATFAGGNPPDVAIMHGSSLVDYAKRGLLMPMDDLAKVTHTDLSDAVPAAKIAIQYEGKDYAVPFDVHAGLAHVNVGLFAKAGLVDTSGNPVMPKSPEEFLAQAKQVKAKTGKDYLGVARAGDQLGVHMFESLLEQQGGGVLNADNTQGAIDTPEAKNALNLMDQIFSGGYAKGKQTYDAAQQAFLNGQTAILFNGTWVVDQYNSTAKFKYMSMNFPTLYKQPAVWSDSHTWVIPKHKDANPVKYRAAMEFINFLYDHDATWALGTGHIAARTSVLKSPEYAKAPQRASYADTGLTVAHPVPHIANWPAVSKALVQAIESIWFQGVPVDKALKDGQAAITAALQGS